MREADANVEAWLWPNELPARWEYAPLARVAMEVPSVSNLPCVFRLFEPSVCRTLRFRSASACETSRSLLLSAYFWRSTALGVWPKIGEFWWKLTSAVLKDSASFVGFRSSPAPLSRAYDD